MLCPGCAARQRAAQGSPGRGEQGWRAGHWGIGARPRARRAHGGGTAARQPEKRGGGGGGGTYGRGTCTASSTCLAPTACALWRSRPCAGRGVPRSRSAGSSGAVCTPGSSPGTAGSWPPLSSAAGWAPHAPPPGAGAPATCRARRRAGRAGRALGLGLSRRRCCGAGGCGSPSGSPRQTSPGRASRASAWWRASCAGWCSRRCPAQPSPRPRHGSSQSFPAAAPADWRSSCRCRRAPLGAAQRCVPVSGPQCRQRPSAKGPFKGGSLLRPRCRSRARQGKPSQVPGCLRPCGRAVSAA